MPWLNFRLAAARVIAAGGKAMRAVVTEGGITAAAPGLYGRLSLFSFTVFCLNALTLLYFYGIAGYSDLAGGEREGTLVERLTAALFVGAGLALLLAAVAVGRAAPVYILAALGLFFIAGEEISWGQHIFGFATPGFVEEVNHQGETNFHNIISFWLFQMLIHRLPELGCVATVAAFLVGKYRLGKLPLPSLWLAFFFAMAAMLHREVSLAEAIAVEGGAFLPIMGIFLGVALLTRDKRLLLAVVALVMLSGAIFSVRGTFTLLNQEDAYWTFSEIVEYLLGLAAFLYGLQSLRDGGREPWRTWWRRVSRVGAGPEVAVDCTPPPPSRRSVAGPEGGDTIPGGGVAGGLPAGGRGQYRAGRFRSAV